MTNMETVKLPCLKLLLTVHMPTHATLKSVGLDLYSPTKKKAYLVICEVSQMLSTECGAKGFGSMGQ